MLNFNSAKFIQSAAQLNQAPTDAAVEIVFAGRSNSGKSSTINALTNTKNLARTSKTPGRTQLINYFALQAQPGTYLVDLPGYGYAKVSKTIKAHWDKLLTEYFAYNQNIAGVIQIIDIRNALLENDIAFIQWIASFGHKLRLILNKADKISKNQAKSKLLQIQKQLQNIPNVEVSMLSAAKGTNVEELKLIIQNLTH